VILRSEERGNSSGSYPAAVSGINGVEPSGCARIANERVAMKSLKVSALHTASYVENKDFGNTFIKVKFPLCLIHQAPRHEDIW
jgi:hypothetical protein